MSKKDSSADAAEAAICATTQPWDFDLSPGAEPTAGDGARLSARGAETRALAHRLAGVASALVGAELDAFARSLCERHTLDVLRSRQRDYDALARVAAYLPVGAYAPARARIDSALCMTRTRRAPAAPPAERLEAARARAERQAIRAARRAAALARREVWGLGAADSHG